MTLTREQQSLTYWQEQLVGELSLLNLPIDYPRVATLSPEQVSYDFMLNVDLVKNLMEEADISAHTLFLTTFQVLLYRYTEQEDILVGFQFSGQSPDWGIVRTNLPEFEQGFGASTVQHCLTHMHQHVQAALEYPTSRLHDLIKALHLKIDSGYAPFFQAGFVYQQGCNKQQCSQQEPALSSGKPVVPLELTLTITPSDDGDTHSATLTYDPALFKSDTITRIAAHYQTLLNGIIDNPDQTIASLPLLTEAERHQLLVEWNDTATDYPRDKCIHQLFEEQVERAPDAIAVVFEAQQLTYAELNHRANQLAHHLQSLGVGPETLVGICLERSIEMVVGLLGILKAGGAYVPLDPNYPQERLAFMIDDAGIRLLVTQEKLHRTLPVACPTVFLDRQCEPMNAQGKGNLIPALTADNLAYLMYTSGSTGTPKGVQIIHRNVVRLVKKTNFLQFSADDVFLHLSSISFDAATLEIWGPLLNGGKLIVMPPQQPSLHELGAAIQRHQITTLWLSAGLFHLMVDEQLADLQPVRTLLAGGDVLSVAHVQRAVQALPNCQLINGYGPTENTTFTCCYPVSAHAPPERSIPIGKPIANTQVYILNSVLQPVPVGVFGELYASGDGLGRGYHQRAELTAEKFILNPFGKPGSGERLYRTGDLARWLQDGNIEFGGRIDTQVKIRGFRIELSEIETVLTQHPAVSEAVVVAYQEGNSLGVSEKQLAAYIVAGQVDQATAVAHVEEWQQLYEETYAPAAQQETLAFNLTGWNSSYTGQPIPAVEMAAWVADTVTEIRNLQPQRVLEIGCGTGLLLAQLAPDCVEYWGTDYSTKVLAHTQRLQSTTPALRHVQLAQRMADDFTGIPTGAFDCVILNSIAQYFPSVDYLLRVLAGAVRVVNPGGVIYVGDVRNYRLLSAYHAAVQLYQSPADTTLAQLQTAIQQRLQDEEELLIDPDFFQALPHYLPQIDRVEIHLKRGHYHNELTQFRYQVVLHLADNTTTWDATTVAPCAEASWLPASWTLATLEEKLITQTGQGLVVRNIPNARVQAAMTTLAMLERAQNGQSQVSDVAHLRAALANQPGGVEPEALWALGEYLLYQVSVTWAAAPGLMDATFVPCGMVHPKYDPATLPKPTSRSWREYTNNPLLGKLNHTLVPTLRSYVQTKLPDYMIPAAFIFLDRLPLTPNGKVDRRSLPVPARDRVGVVADLVAPQTDIEQMIAAIWQEVLQVKVVGLYDNFFELGGHSLMAMQVASRIKSIFKMQMPVRTLFDYLTIAELAKHVEALSAAHQMSVQAKEMIGQAVTDAERENEEW